MNVGENDLWLLNFDTSSGVHADVRRAAERGSRTVPSSGYLIALLDAADELASIKRSQQPAACISCGKMLDPVDWISATPLPGFVCSYDCYTAAREAAERKTAP